MWYDNHYQMASQQEGFWRLPSAMAVPLVSERGHFAVLSKLVWGLWPLSMHLGKSKPPPFPYLHRLLICKCFHPSWKTNECSPHASVSSGANFRLFLLGFRSDTLLSFETSNVLFPRKVWSEENGNIWQRNKVSLPQLHLVYGIMYVKRNETLVEIKAYASADLELLAGCRLNTKCGRFSWGSFVLLFFEL